MRLKKKLFYWYELIFFSTLILFLSVSTSFLHEVVDLLLRRVENFPAPIDYIDLSFNLYDLHTYKYILDILKRSIAAAVSCYTMNEWMNEWVNL